MKWIGAGTVVLAATLAICGAQVARAQAPGQYGERVGNTYLPSTHDAGCGGVLCSTLPVDPAHPTEVLAPPPCQGLLCGLTPYGMQPPHTAAEAAAVERQRAAAAQATAALPPEPAPPAKHLRRHRKKVRAAAVAAPRTPAPAAPLQ